MATPNIKSLEKQVRDSQEAQARLMRERDHYRSMADASATQKPLFFTKMFNEMDAVTKSMLVRACEDTISNVFIAMDSNTRDTDPLRWATIVESLREDLEAHVLNTSGYRWTISKVGSVAGSLDFNLHGANAKHRDYIDVTLAHLGYKRPRHNARDLTEAERIKESPTPTPVAVKLHTRIFRRDF